VSTLPETLLSAPVPSRRVGRRIGSVAAGLVFIFVASTLVDAILHATAVFPPAGETMSDALFALALSYRVVFDLAGCYLTARLAPDRPMAHALVLGGIGLALSAIGVALMAGQGPLWYPLALAASAIPTAWLGGAVRNRELRAR
jgi:hypothetical protein